MLAPRQVRVDVDLREARARRYDDVLGEDEGARRVVELHAHVEGLVRGVEDREVLLKAHAQARRTLGEPPGRRRRDAFGRLPAFPAATPVVRELRDQRTGRVQTLDDGGRRDVGQDEGIRIHVQADPLVWADGELSSHAGAGVAHVGHAGQDGHRVRVVDLQIRLVATRRVRQGEVIARIRGLDVDAGPVVIDDGDGANRAGRGVGEAAQRDAERLVRLRVAVVGQIDGDRARHGARIERQDGRCVDVVMRGTR